MIDALPLAGPGLAGAVLGAAFYGGLWWTVQRAVASPRPARWFLASLVLRTAAVLAGLYLVGDGQWQRLVPALLGFVIARPLVIRLVRAASPGS